MGISDVGEHMHQPLDKMINAHLFSQHLGKQQSINRQLQT
jgi:hypothetical protein